ncbi:hypothetical protein BURK1_03766 [Burkholderiales bacterium]|nr:hypothetical protein BURK1_03766 [Burkholderiales bacterium]
MVDEAAYRAARSASVPLPCVFGKALASGCAGCSTSVRRALAEREAIGCASPEAHAGCSRLAALLRERAAFVLKLAPEAPLPHAAAMKLQCGGLAGLRAGVGSTEGDVRRLVALAIERRGGLADLPWRTIVAAVAGWQGRHRYRGPKP